MNNYRVGIGYDVHAFILGRDLILGGKKIDYKFGLAGHSDADVLLHAIIDSLAGASGLPDIGQLFPDTDMRYKNISSIKLLNEISLKLSSSNISVINIDSVIICQEPKISPHIDDMKQNISNVLGIEKSHIGIKGKTTEGLGFAGRGEGIGAHAVALIHVRP